MANIPLFSPQHLWILLACGLCGAWYILEAKATTEEERRHMTRLLGILLLWVYPVSLFMRLILIPDMPWQERLPFHMCSVMPFIAAGALLTGCPYMSALTYFMGTLVCIQALITPSLPYGFPHPIFFEFFISHALIVLAALYLPLVQSWRPRPRDFLKAFYFGIGYALVMLALNPLLDTNFGFVMSAPAGGSILDFLGPWPWYLFGMMIPAFICMWLLTLPFRGSKTADYPTH